MSAPGDDVVHGLRAAAKLTGRSPSGVQKLVDTGKLPATKNDEGYTFAIGDLQALPLPLRASTVDTVGMTMASNVTSPATAEPAVAVPSVLAPRALSLSDTAPSPAADNGELAAKVFGLFESGQSAIEVIIATKEPPATIEALYLTWLRLKAADVTSTQAQTRVVALEKTTLELRDVADQLSAVVNAHDSLVAELTTEVWGQHQVVDGLLARTAGLERRGRPGHEPSELAGLRRQLAAVEELVRAMPTAHMPTGQMCGACGGQVIVPSACSSCGRGTARV